jgi:diamine N-acetyltransferase
MNVDDETPEIVLRPTTDFDVDWVLDVEHDPAIEPFITRWPRQLHATTMRSENARHLVITSPDGERLGYVILRGVTDPGANIELLRIVVARRGGGVGRAALRAVKRIVFDELGAHRLWLDVITTNDPARRLYRSEGFVEEGVLREAARRADGFASLVLMSLLEQEYRGD